MMFLNTLLIVNKFNELDCTTHLGAKHGRHEISALASFVLFLRFGPLSPAFVPL